MTYFTLSIAALSILVYCFAITIKSDAKKVLLHRLVDNHLKMQTLYAELENLIFHRNYSAYAILDSTMSYDLYLTGIKHQNVIFERELDELRRSKFSKDVQKRFYSLIKQHEKTLMILQCELHRVLNTRLLRPSEDDQWSA